jgi:hypothetical protein
MIDRYAHIEHSRPLVGLCDGVVRVVGRLRAADDMSPHDADLVAGLYVDDLARDRGVKARVAGEVCVVDV